MAGRNIWGTKRNRWGAPSSDGGSVAVVDNLNSTSATDALSAKQGKVLNDSKFGKVECTYAVDEASQLSTKTHGEGLTCLCKGDGKIYTSDGTAWNGGVLGLLGVLYIAESETYVYDTNKFVLISTDNAKTLNGHNENYFAKESEAAKKSGSYPSMTVGSANNLNGYHNVNASYLRRTSAGSESIGSGVAMIRSLKGNSYVWNEKIKNGNFIDATSWNGITSVNNNIAFLAANAPSNCYISQQNVNIITNHKLYISFWLKINCADNNYTGSYTIGYLYKTGFQTQWFPKHIGSSYFNQWKKENFIITATQNNVFIVGAYRYSGDFIPFTEGEGIELKNIMFIDLTLMFGAGNEPATVEAFESWCAEQGIDLDKYYPYNEGEVINCKADAIKTDGFNQYDNTTGKANVIKNNIYQITGTYTSLTLGGETITPDANGYFTPTANGELTVNSGDATTCIHLKWSGKKDGEFEQHWSEALNLNLTSVTGKVNGAGASETIFPDGLVKVGSEADELDVDSDGKSRRAIKRFGKQSITGAIGDTITLTGCKADTTNTICAQGALSAIGTLSGMTLTLTAAVTNLDVYFELAAPINYTLDTPIGMTYRVDDFGTETAQVLSDGSLVDADITKTAPLNYDVVYSLNVVDTVRNLNRNYLGMTGANNTFAALRTALLGYGITLTLGEYDETNGYYHVTISERWKPAAAAPETASSNGTAGDYFVDTDYFYVCVATNTWKRFALSTW